MKRIFIVLVFIQISLFPGVTGKLAGKVTDASTGETLVGANVIMVGTTYGAASDINGNYTILNIPPGTYSVKVSYLGYEPVVVNEIRIIVDQTTSINFELSSQLIKVDEVVVTAKAPLIQKDLTSSKSVISRENIEALPVATFTELLSLQAGVVGSGSNLHIRGGRSNEVAYLIDGMYVKDPLLGGLATQINNDAIQEMSLLSGTFNAEYGNALSGVVNIVTRDGKDVFSGKIEGRSSEFGVKRYSDLHENRVNGSLEGPVVPGHLRFFISGETDNRGSYLPFGYHRNQTIFAKLNAVSIPNLRIALSNRGSKDSRQNYSHTYKYIPDQYYRSRSDSWQSTLTATHSLGTNFFYDFRASYFNQGYYRGLDKDTALYLPAAEDTYFQGYGNGFEFLSRSDPEEIIDSRTVTVDAKFDAVWQINQSNETKFGLQYKSHELRLNSIYGPKRTAPYLNNYESEPFEASGYVQDKIELPNLVINLGVRFDYLNANAEFRNNPLDPTSIVKVKSRQQISPRVGIAHPISDKTKLHFAYGHFFQNPDFQFLFENQQYDLNVREPLFGQANLDAQRTIAYEVGVAHQFTDRVGIKVAAYYKDVTGLIGTRYSFPYFEGRYVGYTVYVNEDYANIRGFEVNFDIRPDRYFSGGLTYTYSVAKGSASSETEQYPGTQESTQLYYLDFDKTHVFNSTFTLSVPQNEGPELFGYKILQDMDFSAIFKMSSGYPYTPGGRDVGFVVRNSLRSPSIYTLDLMIGKEFYFTNSLRLRIFAEIFNLTDNKNVLYVYTDTGDPDFTTVGGQSSEYMRDPSNYGSPRTIRLGASFRF
ncbi:MAG: carboxypeptidase-like regulatory domain-containing protein [Ignavibacteriaceae bacterium]